MAQLKAGSTVGGKKILDESFEMPEVDLTDYATYSYVDQQVANVDATALQGRTPNSFIQVVMHNNSAYMARPVGAISVLWVGAVEPYYAQDNDLWIGG